MHDMPATPQLQERCLKHRIRVCHKQALGGRTGSSRQVSVQERNAHRILDAAAADLGTDQSCSGVQGRGSISSGAGLAMSTLEKLSPCTLPQHESIWMVV